MPQQLPTPGVIVFDMDGTLIDVSSSYREGVPLAASAYLRMLGLTPPRLTADVFEPFKRMGGFNDDWNLTAGLLELLLAPMPAAGPLPAVLPPDQPSFIALLQQAAAPLAGSTPVLPDLQALIPRVQAAGGGLEGLRQITGRHNAHLVWRTGGPLHTDLVQRIFSEIYLGGPLFERGYGDMPRFHSGSGLIDCETVYISPREMEEIAAIARLGLATGRTRYEAGYTLDKTGLVRLFGAISTMDDALAEEERCGESRLKPHPFLLERTADILDPDGVSPAVYVGDMPDDIVAARNASGRPWYSVALLTGQDRNGLREHFLGLGADAVLDDVRELPALFASNS